MGFWDNFSGLAVTAAAPKTTAQISAAFNPVVPNNQFYYDPTNEYVTRDQAMQVPAFARGRNIICNTAATLPLKAFNKITGQQVDPSPLLKQIDPAVPNVVTLSWTFEDLLLHSYAYWLVLEVSPVDNRPTKARRIDPMRVSYFTDPQTQTIIDGFNVDGNPAPLQGVGSIIMFNGLDEGVLRRAGRTIATALAIEKAVSRMADEPIPGQVLRNTGVDLPADQVTGLLTAWKAARQTRNTAYLSGALELQTYGYDATQLQLAENKMQIASEIARLIGIPAWYLNAESASATYSNVSAERRALIDFSLKPLLLAVSERISQDDLTPMGQTVRFSLEEYLRGNPQEQLDVIRGYIELNLITEDEARKMLDLAPRGNPNATTV